SRLKKGEVRVTVIATGFGAGKYNNGNPVVAPAISVKKPVMNIEIIDEEEEWDVPAFLRRKKDPDDKK
ncbi:MAG: hypothetical protein AAB789_01025, partial [Patescibacteria group bacterium]